MEQAAVSILTRAVSLDSSNRYMEALVCYQEGLEFLIDVFKGLPPGRKRDEIKQKINVYIDRAEKIKTIVQEKKKQGRYHEEIKISDNSRGYSYERIMGRFMDCNVDSIEIVDPYIKNFNQFCNLLRFCELAVKKCVNLKVVKLITGDSKNEPSGQAEWLESLAQDLKENHKINFQVDYSTTLHDREIIFSNGWVIKIGRGLDYFKHPNTKYSLGKFDLNFRQCRETKIDIYYQEVTK